EATLSLGGQVLGAGPLQKEMSPGQYTVRAEMQGFQPAEEKFTVVPGVQQEITITLKPSGTNASYEKGVQSEAQKLWPQAIAAYEMALSSDAGAAAAYDRLANVCRGNGRYRDAVDLLTTATGKIPDYAG